jgi:TetR/AcrR family transcriptional repressor of nem operon
MGAVRVTSERRAETRQRILDAALRLFRQHGIDAVGVDAIMHQAGLTHGGFYTYFPSKEALVAETSAASLARSASRWEQIVQEHDSRSARARIVGSYLDPAHVVAAERGCVLTTLGPEVARRPEAKPAFTAAIQRMVDALAACMPEHGRDSVLATLASMVGAVVLARLADDPDLAVEFLAAARKNAGLD